MEKVVKKSLPKQIAEIIEQKISKGEYEIGDKLPTEPELVSYFGVSRNTLREAIQSLTNSGLLESRQGDGTYVVAKERLQVELFNALSSTKQKDVLEVRNLLEHYVVTSAIKNCTEEDIQIIEEKLELRKKQTDSIKETTQADLNFHMAIAKATHNELLFNIYGYVSEYFNQFIYEKLYMHSKDTEYIDEIHDKLFDAIKSRNLDFANECISKIIEI